MFLISLDLYPYLHILFTMSFPNVFQQYLSELVLVVCSVPLVVISFFCFIGSISFFVICFIHMYLLGCDFHVGQLFVPVHLRFPLQGWCLRDVEGFYHIYSVLIVPIVQVSKVMVVQVYKVLSCQLPDIALRNSEKRKANCQ